MASHSRSGDGTTEPDRIARVLADGRRRRVIAILADAGPSISLEDLARLVARHEADRRGGRGADRDDAVHLALYHKDVPKLADADLVDWDRDRDVVRPGRAYRSGLAVIDAIAEAREDQSDGSGSSTVPTGAIGRRTIDR